MTLDQRSVDLIKFIDITEPNLPNNLEDLAKLIDEKGSYFESTLAYAARSSSEGWEEIITVDNQLVKVPSVNNGRSLFTGLEFCNIASFALYDSLQALDPLKFYVQVVRVNTNFEREKWDNPDHDFYSSGHSIVKVTELATNESLFIDPTFGQVDHRFAGKMLVARETELQKYYQSERDQQAVNYTDTSNTREKQFATLAFMSVKQKEYDMLVNSLLNRDQEKQQFKLAA